MCYKSEDKIKEGSAEKFIKGIIARGHESVLEHGSITASMLALTMAVKYPVFFEDVEA